MIISIDAEKVFNKIKHPFMMKTLQKGSIKETFLNTIKAKYGKPIANIILNCEKLNIFPQISGTGERCVLLPLFIFYFGSPGHSRIQIGKEVKLSLFADDMILYIENPKDVNRKLL